MHFYAFLVLLSAPLALANNEKSELQSCADLKETPAKFEAALESAVYPEIAEKLSTGDIPDYDPTPLSRQDVSSKFEKGVLFVPDIHGTQSILEYVIKLINKEHLNWIGVEHLPVEFQPAVDRYFAVSPKSLDEPAALLQLEQALRDNIKRNGLLRFRGDPTHTGPYILGPREEASVREVLAIVAAAKKNGIRVVAIDNHQIAIESTQAHQAMMAARNQLWARVIPVDGKGVIWGGASHFFQSTRVRVSDFLRERAPTLDQYVLSFSAPEVTSRYMQIVRLHSSLTRAYQFPKDSAEGQKAIDYGNTYIEKLLEFIADPKLDDRDLMLGLVEAAEISVQAPQWLNMVETALANPRSSENIRVFLAAEIEYAAKTTAENSPVYAALGKLIENVLGRAKKPENKTVAGLARALEYRKDLITPKLLKDLLSKADNLASFSAIGNILQALWKNNTNGSQEYRTVAETWFSRNNAARIKAGYKPLVIPK